MPCVRVLRMDGLFDRGGGFNLPQRNKPNLVPSGEDANPMNRRLPAEVVTRRRPPTKAPKVEEKKDEDVVVELKAAVAIKAEARPKWLTKAFKQAEESKSVVSELYTIVSSQKYAKGLPEKIGRKLLAIIHDNLSAFSEKQQRFLKSKDEEVDAASRMEEMMARCRAFVRENANGFEDRAAEAAAVERKAKGDDIEAQAEAADLEKLKLKAEREAAEKAKKEAQELEEKARLEELERKARQKRLAAQAAEAAERELRRATEEELARKRQLEMEADSSMLFLERREQEKAQTPVERRETSGSVAKAARGNRGMSRSRSISARSKASSAPSRRKKDRSRDRKRRNGESERQKSRKKIDGKRKRRRHSSSDSDKA